MGISPLLRTIALSTGPGLPTLMVVDQRRGTAGQQRFALTIQDGPHPALCVPPIQRVDIHKHRCVLQYLSLRDLQRVQVQQDLQRAVGAVVEVLTAVRVNLRTLP